MGELSKTWDASWLMLPYNGLGPPPLFGDANMAPGHTWTLPKKYWESPKKYSSDEAAFAKIRGEDFESLEESPQRMGSRVASKGALKTIGGATSGRYGALCESVSRAKEVRKSQESV